MGFDYVICPESPGHGRTILCVTPGPFTPMLKLSCAVPVAGRLVLTHTEDESRGV